MQMKLKPLKAGVEKLPAKDHVKDFLENHEIKPTEAKLKDTPDSWSLNIFERIWLWVKGVPETIKKGVEFVTQLPKAISDLKTTAIIIIVGIIAIGVLYFLFIK
jgi:hypothetical protein